MTDLNLQETVSEGDGVDGVDGGPAGSAVTTVSGVMTIRHDMADVLPELVLPWRAATAPEPRLVVLNGPLADDLGLDRRVLESDDGVGVLSGNLVPEGASPVAMAYAGHQFGSYSPLLGDGRALLLGELLDPDGATLRDVHLKGSGRTPFARGGDGRATIGPMLREYLVSEFLARVGVPTTRSLAVVTTGENVWRDGAEPGAVLTRIAASHIRVGTFEYAVRAGGTDLVRRLADHSIVRHRPELRDTSDPYVGLLRSVVDAQAYLVARWMTLGFIHGVMNTDNMTISGEGIDYGPCAFMDVYDPSTVFSSIDHGGRYAYGNQVRVAAWNLARLAETMLTLLDDDLDTAVATATEVVKGFVDRFKIHWDRDMGRKLGLDAPSSDAVTISRLADELTTIMAAERMDWTLTFRDLADRLRRSSTDGASGPTRATGTVGGVPASGSLTTWLAEWSSSVLSTGADPAAVADRMDSVNPVHIPRNHLVDHALRLATAGDLSAFEELVDVLTDPFDADGVDERFGRPAPVEFTTGYRTFCGT